MENIKLGDRVTVLGKKSKGEVAFIGNTHFSEGTWIGIILDEPKGKHNGTLDGKQYFKCEKKHGVFVKPPQVEKENIDDLMRNDDSQSRNQNREIFRYSNYLRSSSKLKMHKHASALKNEENDTLTSELKTPDDGIQQDNPTQNGTQRDLELQELKEENEELKKKLKSTEDSLEEITRKYSKAMEEIKHLKFDLNCKKKQIQVQKCNLKLLKIRQCNHYQKIDFDKMSAKNPDCTGRRSHEVTQAPISDDSSWNSDDELDLESLKALASVQRVTQLEEQNRRMIQELLKLKEFVKSNCHSQFTGIDVPEKRFHWRRKLDDTNYYTCSEGSSTAIQHDNYLPALQKNYSTILAEMKKFSDAIREKRLRNNSEALSARTVQATSNSKPSQKEQTTEDNNCFQYNHHLLNPLPSSNYKTTLELSNTQRSTGTYRSSVIDNSQQPAILHSDAYAHENKVVQELNKKEYDISRHFQSNLSTISTLSSGNVVAPVMMTTSDRDPVRFSSTCFGEQVNGVPISILDSEKAENHITFPSHRTQVATH